MKQQQLEAELAALRANQIGWVPLGADGKPHRTATRAGWDRKSGLNPPRVYATEGRACGYSPVGDARPVYMAD